MYIDKDQFKKEYAAAIAEAYSRPLDECTGLEKYLTLANFVNEIAMPIRKKTSERHFKTKQKKIYYFSMEFLIGPLLDNYMINLGIRETIAEGLNELGEDIDAICSFAKDPGLGNGGLGRLAACFLDSMAALGVPGVGMGLRYNYGLFRQSIESGFQIEEPDDWLKDGYPWELAKPSEAVVVRYGGRVDREMVDGKIKYKHVDYESVLATPYDVPIVGYGGEDVNVLRLWSAGPVKLNINMNKFSRGEYSEAMSERNNAEAITAFLYPDDTYETGKVLRLKQEYMLVCAGIQSIFNVYEKCHGTDWTKLAEHVSIHTNDTHPALCVPELMRVLIDEKDMDWDTAWEITKNTISFTNHTVLPEALERWPKDMMSKYLPRIYMIIDEINRRWVQSITPEAGNAIEVINNTEIIHNSDVRMADLSIIGSHSVNGVAALHTEILKESVFNDFYKMRPEMFTNKTNGVSQRRFLIQANPGLTKLIDDSIGEDWRTDFEEIKTLRKFEDDSAFLEKLGAVKRENKLRLAKYIGDTMHIAVDPDSVFDIQVKRIHAYKRQLLNAFKILDLYNTIKENPNIEMQPVTFVFAGKAAPGYVLAKDIIKFICSIADMVNSDPQVNKIIKVIFLENFCVSNAQIIYPAAEISEQISTAGKEASGTSNMKFMMNGAITLGTLDGANIEILDLVGKENFKLFGMTAQDVSRLKNAGGYKSVNELEDTPELKKMVSQLTNSSLSSYNFWGIHDTLTTHNDEFFVMRDFPAYKKAWKELIEGYKDQKEWNRISLVNIAESHFFSSDRTIKEYVRDIWHTDCK